MNLKKNTIFKCNYVWGQIDKEHPNGYENACLETKFGAYKNYGSFAKTFLNVKKWRGILDHGNHCNMAKYFLTDLVLVHYHCRNLKQMTKKIRNNIIGLGYKENVKYLKSSLIKDKNIAGNHHIKDMIRLLENTYTFPTVNITDKNNFVKLDNLIRYFNYLLNNKIYPLTD